MVKLALQESTNYNVTVISTSTKPSQNYATMGGLLEDIQICLLTYLISQSRHC